MNAQRTVLVIFWVAFTVALISLFNCYPGFLYTDSFIRWDQAESIVDGTYIGGNFLTIAPSLLFSMVLYVAGSPAAYSFVQAVFLCFTFIVMVVAAGGRERTGLSISLALLLYIATPQFLAYGLTHAPGVGVAIAMVGITLVLVVNSDLKINFLNTLLLLSLLAFICFGFRQNSLVLLPVFLVIIGFQSELSRYKKIITACILVVVAIFVFSLPSIMGWKTSNQLVKSIAWEMACLVKENEGNLSPAVLSPIGISEEAISSVDCSNVLSLDGPKLDGESDVKRVYSLYGRLILDEPAAFIFNKLRVWSRVIGLDGPLEVTQVINEWPKLAEYGGYEKTKRKSWLVNYYHEFHETVPIYRYPYLLFGFTLLFLGLAYWKSNSSKGAKRAATLFVVATAYYLSFFLVAQRHEVRYFFPTAYIYFIVFGMSLNVLLRSLNFYKWVDKCCTDFTSFAKFKEGLLSAILIIPIIWVISVALMPRISGFFSSDNFEIHAYPLSDSNWLNGVALKGNKNVILVESTPKNLALLRFLDAQDMISIGDHSVSVDSVIVSKDWVHVFLNSETLDPNIWGYPNNLHVYRRPSR